MNFKIDIWIQDIKGEKCATIHNLGGFGRRTMENGRNSFREKGDIDSEEEFLSFRKKNYKNFQ